MLLMRARRTPQLCLQCRYHRTEAIRTKRYSGRRHDGGRTPPPQTRASPAYSAIADKATVEAMITGAIPATYSSKSRSEVSGAYRPAKTPKGAWLEGLEEEEDPWSALLDVGPAKPWGNANTRSAKDNEEAAFKEQETGQGRTRDHGSHRSHTTEDSPPHRRSRHQLLRQEKLRIDALGQPVEAIIVKDPNKMRRPPRDSPIVETDIHPGDVSLDWKDFVPSEQEATPEISPEVLSVVEDLRPADSKVVPRKEFESLRDALVDGFTKNQLAYYYHSNTKTREPNAQSFDPPDYPWIFRQTPWVSVNPVQWDSLTPKKQHALLIMQVNWGLEIQEQVEGIGRTQIWIEPEMFDLIKHPSSGIMDALKRDFLDTSNFETIVYKSTESQLNIYTRKSTASAIISRLDDALKSRVSRRISVEQVPNDIIDETALKHLGNITNSYLRYDKESQTLEVSWLATPDRQVRDASDPTSAHTALEDPADIALRLLIGREQKYLHEEVKVSMPRQGSLNRLSTYLDHQREDRSMAWRDRSRQWLRYISPSNKLPQTPSTRRHIWRRSEIPDPEEKLLDEASFNRLSTTFGHILYTEPERRKKKLHQRRRILSPVVPHPAAFSVILANDEEALSRETAIILNFSPSILARDPAHEGAPQVQIRLPIDPSDMDFSNFVTPLNSTAKAIVPWYLHDVQFPEAAIDMRMTQQIFVPIDLTQPSLQEFLDHAHFDLKEGRLQTPSAVNIAIPYRLLSSTPIPLANSNIEVPYMFMGLEIHQTAEMKHKGFNLRYSSIEAGQHGGQRQELTLFHDGPRTQWQTRDFLTIADKAARESWIEWSEGWKRMRPRSQWDQFIEIDELDNDDSERTSNYEEDDSTQLYEVDDLEEGQSASRSELPVAEVKNESDAEALHEGEASGVDEELAENPKKPDPSSVSQDERSSLPSNSKGSF